MSRVARYTAAGDGVVRLDDEGPLVVWQDYAGLKAENERLHMQFANSEQENARLNNYIERLEVRNAELVPENARLKAEVERLRKAGDDLVLHVEWRNVVFTSSHAFTFKEVIPDCRCSLHNFDKVIEAWNAAKEGKQS